MLPDSSPCVIPMNGWTSAFFVTTRARFPRLAGVAHPSRLAGVGMSREFSRTWRRGRWARTVRARVAVNGGASAARPDGRMPIPTGTLKGKPACPIQ